MSIKLSSLLKKPGYYLKERANLRLIRKSGFFNQAWYLKNNPDIARSSIDPALHYLRFGGYEGRDPGPDFSSAWYLSEYPDVQEAGVNPLIHFLKYGRKEGLESHNLVTVKVSVVTPFFNARKFLKETVESVFAQTYQDWELILVDDGSTDGSTEIALSYTHQYPQKVRYLCHAGHQNRGSSASRNLGFRHSRGELVAFLDSDDVWLPQKLEQHVSLLESHPEADALFGETRYWFSWSLDPQDRMEDYTWDIWKRYGMQPGTIISPTRLLGLLIEYQVMPVPCSLLVRHEAVDRLGGWEGGFFHNPFDDQAFYVKLFHGASVFIAPGCLEKYRQHSESLCSQSEKEGRFVSDRMFFLNWAEKYLSAKGYHDTKLDQYLKHTLMVYHHPVWVRLYPLFYRLVVDPWLRIRQKVSPAQLYNNGYVESDLPAYEGCLDSVDHDAIRGWAWDASQPDNHVKVILSCNGILLVTLDADVLRMDLVEAGKGNGRHAFEFPIPFYLKNGRTYSVDVKISGTDFRLSQSPKMIKWPLQIMSDFHGLKEELKSHTDDGWLGLPLFSTFHRGRVYDQKMDYIPPVGHVHFGHLRRLTPVSKNWGFDRGKPIDRYYIEKFLARYNSDIHGRVLEIGDPGYTQIFGGNRVEQSDVLNIKEGIASTTIVADLSDAPNIPSNVFDCIIFTQTLQFIYDTRATLQTLHRILKPGGVLLATFPGISQTYDVEWGDSSFWSFTKQSAQCLFQEVFQKENFSLHTYGNVLAATSFLYGLAVEELEVQELDYFDPGYAVIIAIRAKK
jgi:glycosyltransferase involved in cell wall biosynthesis/SAM-dependent methyltransferase